MTAAGKFHLNRATGKVARCNASVQACPLGGESGSENHFATVAEAKASYEEAMREQLLTTHSREDALQEFLREHPETVRLQAEVEALEERRSQVSAEVKALPRGSAEWFAKVQERKALFYRGLRLDRERFESLSPELQAAETEAKAQAEARALAERDEWRAAKASEEGNRPYNFHPSIDTKRHEQVAEELISTYAGISVAQVKNSVRKKVRGGMTPTEAYRATWAAYPRRTDKPLVALDLEAAAVPMGEKKLVDTGPYSNIIEVGYVKVMPDGTATRKSYLSGVPSDFLQAAGTGAEHVHNITPAMVEGKPLFVEDGERQRELLEDLRGSVLIAHNASYERNQFTHNLPGFAQALEAKDIEVLDTRDVCKYFVPEATTNSNNSFVEATGGSYEGAHRAYEDAKMTLDALLRARSEAAVALPEA